MLVTMIFDIVTSDEQHVIMPVKRGKRVVYRQGNIVDWPVQPQTPKASWVKWRLAINVMSK